MTGPKKSPAREPVMWIGAGITAIGGAFALINFMNHLDLEEKWEKKFEQKECGAMNPPSSLCTIDVEKEITGIIDESDTALTYTYIGLGVAGAGLVTLAIGYFVLEEGQTPPRDLARTTSNPNSNAYARNKQPTQAASLNFVPVLSPNTVGGVLSGRF